MTTTNSRRIALLTGASVAALGMSALTASPALAAAPHDTLADGTYTGFSTATGTVEICDLASTPGSPCFFGVIDTTNPAAASVPGGFLRQQDTAATVALSMANNGSAEVGAIAIATGAAGNATANATIGFDVIRQTASGTTGDATARIDNEGRLLIDAVASATGAANAVANASVSDAIAQFATIGTLGSGVASAAITNNGSLTVLASAVASGAGFASANASIGAQGIFQGAYNFGTGDAHGTFDNEGALNVAANAAAHGSAASAFASNSEAIYQSATASDGNVTLALTNGTAGAIDIHAHATATGTSGGANATAVVNSAIFQTAQAPTGTASAAIVNDGTINIGAVAFASATSGATANANATLDHGISQVVTGITANANFTNSGTVSEHATATANGGVANAHASAANVNYQIVTGATDAAAGAFFSNTGTVNIGALASAVATAGAANADAFAEYIMEQDVSGGIADATITNTGTMNLAATAKASGTGSANATATANEALVQSVSGWTDGFAQIQNGGQINIGALASATGTDAVADANVVSAIHQTVTAVTSATALFLNATGGSVKMAATANANGTNFADASASVETGVHQIVSNATFAFAQATNEGSISLAANASANAPTGEALAYAHVFDGIWQEVTALPGANASTAVASAKAVNIGTLSMNAHAVANASTYASATASAYDGIYQSVTASSAFANATNHGVIALAATASANGSSAFASAQAGSGIGQSVHGSGFASQVAINAAGGSIAITANAVANATSEEARASASAYGGMVQYGSVGSGTLTATMVNQGKISLAANATANGVTDAVAEAFAGTAMGQFQNAFGGSATVFMSNSGGTITVTANAHAHADNGTGVDTAFASASAFGMGQHIDGGLVHFTAFNSGLLNVGAHATASADNADASASATGVYQVLHGATNVAHFTNVGTINVNAAAFANGTATDTVLNPNVARATAIGYGAFGNDGATSVSAFNGGTIAVSATAAGSEAFASAAGMTVTSVLGTANVTNTGAITVVANASGVLTSSANAVGISVTGGTGPVSVTNTGSISVDAITAGNGTPNAVGILVDNGAGGTTVINNAGDITVRNSVDGGATWTRGMAIDVTGSVTGTPNVVNLLGGNMYGNIDVNAGDQINVASGTTYFDGIINPEFMPVHSSVTGVTTADLDSGLFGEGDLNIDNGGVLELADPRFSGDPSMYDGPAYAFVDTLNMGPDGTIAFQLEPATGGAQAPGTYPQVFADTANLAGTLAVDLQPKNGLLADTYFWDNVIDANTRVGTFDTCGTKIGPLGGSLFLGDVTCTYDANNNVDLSVSRIPFTAITGLNANGTAAAAGLECIYSPTLTGGIGSLFADLFLFDNVNNLNVALNQLAGASYANYLDSFPSLGVHYNDLVDHATNCEIPALAGSVLECRASSPIHIWGQLDYQWRHTDSDAEAGAGKSRRFTGLVGIDTIISNAAFVGIEGGYVSNRYHDSQFGDDMKGTGWQLGVYGDYDPGAFFLKGNVTYNSFNGSSTRNIDFNGLAPGATFTSTVRGDPNVKMWTAGLHGGARFPLGGSSVATPYLNLDYVHAKMDGFIEQNAAGTTGAELHLDSNSESHFFATPGVKFATQFGGVVPELNLGYRYRFGEQRGDINEAFQCQIDTCAFDVVSASHKRGAILAGLSVGGKFGAVDVRIAYEGEFNGDVTSHSGNFKIVVPLGGHAAPPPESAFRNTS